MLVIPSLKEVLGVEGGGKVCLRLWASGAFIELFFIIFPGRGVPDCRDLALRHVLVLPSKKFKCILLRLGFILVYLAKRFETY